MVATNYGILAIMQLIRWPNLVIVAATQLLMRECIMRPLLGTANMELQLSSVLFILLVVSTVLITAGGYAINDYFDRKIDVINKPDSLVVGVSVFPRHAMAWHLGLSFLGVIIGSYVAIHTGQAYLSLVFFMATGLLWFYSTTYKRQLLLGNVIVALLTALVPFIVFLFEFQLLSHEYGSPFHLISKQIIIWISGFAFFAFLLNLIREIVKDAEDFEGDSTYVKNTIPVAWGIKSARILCIILIVVTIVLLFAAWINFIGDYYSIVYFLTALILPLIFAAFMLGKADKKKDYHKVNLVLKIAMITGMGYAVMANLIFNSLMR